MSPLNTIVSSKNSVGFWFHSEHKHMLRFTVFTVKRWFDQKDNIGQTSVIDVHLRNVFKLFYMENNLRQQLWNKQMPVLFFFFFIVPTPHSVVEKPVKVHYNHSPLEPVLMVLFWVEWPLLYIQGNIPLQRFKSQILTMTNLLSGLPFAASRGLYTEFSRATQAELRKKWKSYYSPSKNCRWKSVSQVRLQI